MKILAVQPFQRGQMRFHPVDVFGKVAADRMAAPMPPAEGDAMRVMRQAPSPDDPGPQGAFDRQAEDLRRMSDAGADPASDLAERFALSRPTVYRTLRRTG